MTYLNTSLILAKMSKKQRHVFSLLKGKNQSKYALSFLGARTAVVTSIDLPESKLPELTDFKRLRADLAAQYNAHSEKSPYFSAPDWVGIEIECYLPRDKFGSSNEGRCDGSCRDECECHRCGDCGQHDDNRDCECSCDDTCGGLEDGGYICSVAKSLERAKIKGVSVEKDGSLNDEPREYFGIEIKILTRVSDTKNLEKLCAWLERYEAKVNTSCGLHVHLDMKKASIEKREKLADTFSALLPVMSKLVSPSRLSNTYCKLQVRDEKYSAINLASLRSYGTIEVRLHNGTTNFLKISNWISFLQKIKDYALSDSVALPHSSTMTERLKTMLNLDQSNFDFLKARIAKFRGDTGELIGSMGESEEAA